VWTASPILVTLLLPSYGVLQRALLHRTLRQAAETDAKTGLYHLHAWEQRAAAVLAKGVPFSVLLVDLDHFKRVNDGHGHLVGDDVLAGTSDLMRSVLRPQDVLGRFGGEEFVVLLPEADVCEALAVAERLRATLESTPIAGLPLTASVGVYASEPVEPVRLREALARADLALYAAKRQGRNVVRPYRPSLQLPEQGCDLLASSARTI
jgi:diguanylate cyclase (GGDEF)-like protein